jgi:hypothetical protein
MSIWQQLHELAAEWDRRPGARPHLAARTRNVGGLFRGGDKSARPAAPQPLWRPE